MTSSYFLPRNALEEPNHTCEIDLTKSSVSAPDWCFSTAYMYIKDTWIKVSINGHSIQIAVLPTPSKYKQMEYRSHWSMLWISNQHI